MDVLFFYCAMLGAYNGNIAYETAYGGRDLLPTQSALQKGLTRLYTDTRDLPDPMGGRVEGKPKTLDWQQDSRVVWGRAVK